MLKLYLYGHLNQVQSSRRLEREARRNTELMWLTGKLAPDFKTIADFRRDNGEAIRSACSAFVAIRRGLGLVSGGVVAVDGSRFKAVNTGDKTFTRARCAGASSSPRPASRAGPGPGGDREQGPARAGGSRLLLRRGDPGLRAGRRHAVRAQAADLAAKADGRFGKADFVYMPEENVCRRPAGQRPPWHMTTIENGMSLHRY